jgi:hypothetical protein
MPKTYVFEVVGVAAVPGAAYGIETIEIAETRPGSVTMKPDVALVANGPEVVVMYASRSEASTPGTVKVCSTVWSVVVMAGERLTAISRIEIPAPGSALELAYPPSSRSGI